MCPEVLNSSSGVAEDKETNGQTDCCVIQRHDFAAVAQKSSSYFTSVAEQILPMHVMSATKQLVVVSHKLHGLANMAQGFEDL